MKKRTEFEQNLETLVTNMNRFHKFQNKILTRKCDSLIICPPNVKSYQKIGTKDNWIGDRK